MDVAKAVKDIKAGKIEFRVDKTGNIHAPIGKIAFPLGAARGELHGLHGHHRALQAVGREGRVHPDGRPVEHDGARASASITGLYR